ncbi:5-oxoprolinase subunit PxpA [Sinomonas sp. ASV322]|uniref:LamB/YcsF family protein n=1 Tax=Sinomonas sp. ASV322 TaxID=3041920 RepID=UPI0027DD82B9|nr:5-oxoprolinase subunit PxpA [Sinomonas sp. ASV322]MDQ4502561.1 5-oxoprolinase subunit PxpA [Sinomonas sp. ASV322]
MASIDRLGIDRLGIDLNSDVGESFGNWTFGDDAAIFASVSSANVACGFHAGDPSGIRATCRAAAAAGVTVGAHPGYRDLAGFGRRFMDVAPNELTDDVVYQIGALRGLAQAAGTEVRYVKPHGALYNTIVHHAEQAKAVARAVAEVDPALPILVLPNSEIERAARAAGLRTVAEAFADRAYSPDGTLVSRREPGSVLHDLDAIVEHVLRLLDGEVRAIDGSVVPIAAESICVHGDTAGAVAMAARIREAITAAGVPIASFV